MSLRPFITIGVAGILLLAARPVTAASAPIQSPFLRAVDDMMAELSADSARASATIRRAYRDHLELLMLNGYTDMEGALDNGGLVPLPADPLRFNLMPRLDGPHPIGEKDLDNQTSYIAARPAMIGVLLEIASRVKTGPLEITSLVRHNEYQDALRTTNTNATTSVPMHTMGLAVDIALVNSELKTVYEIRDVLRRMQRNGDILVIGERRQLVFHVVPHPSRLGHFTDVYIRNVGLPPTAQSAHVVAAGPVTPARRLRGIATVTAEVLAVQPLSASVDGAFAAPAIAGAVAASVPRMSASAAAMQKAASSAGVIIRRWFVLFLGLLGVMWRLAPRPSIRPALFESRP
jgi:hypothetical protein